MYDRKLQELLNFDALGEAERIHGRRTEEATDLGLILHMGASAARDAALIERRDSCLIMETEPYVEIITDLGFEPLIADQFVSSQGEVEHDTYYVYGHRGGLILAFDTYGSRRNSGKVYYNWVPSEEGRKESGIRSSGRMIGDANDNDVWVGDHDCREAIVHAIMGLTHYGRFLPIWIGNPNMRLLNYSEWRKWEEIDLDAITQERVSRFPDWAKAIVAVTANER